MATGNQVFK